jgi:hypothetical protein
MQTREETNTEAFLLNTPLAGPQDVEHVERNTNADVAYLLRPPR